MVEVLGEVSEGKDPQLFLTILMGFSEETDQGVVRYEERLRIPLDTAWTIVEAIQTLGPEQARTFAEVMLVITRLGPLNKNPMPSPQEKLRLFQGITLISTMFNRRWDDLEDRVIDFTYQWMLHRRMTRQMAAKFASSKLGHVSTDAWRKKVDRWARVHGYPPLGQTKRTPRK